MYRFLLRIPDSLAVLLKEQAAENGRSLNAEIFWRLKQSLGGYKR